MIRERKKYLKKKKRKKTTLKERKALTKTENFSKKQVNEEKPRAIPKQGQWRKEKPDAVLKTAP